MFKGDRQRPIKAIYRDSRTEFFLMMAKLN
jgi:hypothetical protein